MASKSATVLGLIASPDRRIRVADLESDGRVLWGKRDAKGRLAWLAPAAIRLLGKRPAVLVTTTQLEVVALPGNEHEPADFAALSRVVQERHAQLSGSDPLQRSMLGTLMSVQIVGILLALGVLLIVAAMALPVILDRMPGF